MLSEHEMNVRMAVELIRAGLCRVDAEDVAEATGLHVKTVINWRDKEVDMPRLRVFVLMADYFDISVSIDDLNTLTNVRETAS